MKQKTAMQDLIDEMNKAPLMYSSSLFLIEHLNLLEKEKEQIIEARNSALRDKYKSIINDLTTYGQAKIDVKSSEDYFNETYKQD